MHILAVRFSSLGDVALCLPALKAVLAAQPNWRITLVTRPRFAPIFQQQERLTVFPADVELKYRGPWGMLQVARDVERLHGKVDALVDLHDNLRSALLRLYFKTQGKRVFKYEKGRKEKKKLLGNLAHQPPLPHTTERYLAAFQPLFHPALPALPAPPLFQIPMEDQTLAKRFIQSLEVEKGVIGIAPFAQYGLKCLPELVIRQYAKAQVQAGYHVLWFGGGIVERRKLDTWTEPGMTNLAGRFPMTLELALLPHLKWMVAMDSGNMHLAALAGTPLLSVWGPTHPHLGFGPYGQPTSVLQISPDELPCRPCSVFGNQPCHRGDHACMNQIQLETT